MDMKHLLWYDKPAKDWNEALPLGNGRMGAMVFGGYEKETLWLNEDTCWSGRPRFYTQERAKAAFDEAAELAREGKLKEAERRLEEDFTARPSEMYLPVGKLELSFFHEKVSAYRRELDLQTALSCVTYEDSGIRFQRRSFLSYPDQVLVLHISCNGKEKVSFDVCMDTPLQGEVTDCAVKGAGGTLVLEGICPVSEIERGENQVKARLIYPERIEEQGMRFVTALQVTAAGGGIHCRGGRKKGLSVRDAEEALIILGIRTTYAGWDQDPSRETRAHISECLKEISRASELGFERLYARHAADHAALYGRCELTLPDGEGAHLPTDLRLQNHAAHKDKALYALLFHYGRYLLLASSRAGSQAANLQGIWNPHVNPPWNSNYTLNINTEMNYWPAAEAGLIECLEPVARLAKELTESGRRTAKAYYGAEGACAHHNTDLWRLSTPVGNGEEGSAVWAFWPFGLGWLCRPVTEYWMQTKDETYLKETLRPVLEESARFFLSMLREEKKKRSDPICQALVFMPATSPENRFIYETEEGERVRCALDQSTAMAQGIVTDVFSMILKVERKIREIQKKQGKRSAGPKAEEETFFHPELLRKIKEVLPRLKKTEIGEDGRLMEWSGKWEEADPHHRHLSHLYGVYPASFLRDAKPGERERYLEAAEKSLLQRGSEGTGWSLAWKACLWAALGRGDRAEELLDMQLRLCGSEARFPEGGGSYANLLCAHPPFQIDGNFGACAGIASLLMQEKEGEVVLLPALPPDWTEGAVRGLRTSSGEEISFRWENGTVVEEREDRKDGAN